MYTLDTNAIIYYLKADPKATSVLEGIFAEDIPIYISTITEIELFSFSDLGQSEVEQIENMLKTLAAISVDSRIARIAGSLRRLYNLKVADAAIAATSMFTGSSLVTRNVKDFKNVPNLPLTRI